MKNLLVIICIFYFLVNPVESKAQLTFKSSFIKTYADGDKEDSVKKQFFDSIIIFGTDKVEFKDKSVWNDLYHTIILVDTLSRTRNARYLCEDRIYILSKRDNTVTVYHNGTREVNKYFGYFIEE